MVTRILCLTWYIHQNLLWVNLIIWDFIIIVFFFFDEFHLSILQMHYTTVTIQEVTAKEIICLCVLRIWNKLIAEQLAGIMRSAQLIITVNVYELYCSIANSLFLKWYIIVKYFLYCSKPGKLSVHMQHHDFSCKMNQMKLQIFDMNKWWQLWY